MRLLWVCSFCLLIGSAVGRAQRYEDFTTRTPLDERGLLIVGFRGGRESWDNEHRGVRKLALRLRAMTLPGVHVETVENTSGGWPPTSSGPPSTVTGMAGWTSGNAPPGA
jgi:hypothetical protein